MVALCGDGADVGLYRRCGGELYSVGDTVSGCGVLGAGDTQARVAVL